MAHQDLKILLGKIIFKIKINTMKSYSVISLSIAIISTLAMHNSNCQKAVNDIDFDIKKGIQFAAIPMMHHKLLASQPYIQSCIATGGFLLTGNTTTPLEKRHEGELIIPTGAKEEHICKEYLANGFSYLASNYASRKLAYTIAEKGYNKSYLTEQFDKLNTLLPERMLGYEIRENIRPITQTCSKTITHPLTQELVFHAIGSLAAKQCVNLLNCLEFNK